MKNEKGISLMVLIIMIVVIIILSVITIRSSDSTVDESIDAKEKAEETMDNEKIKEIITYEMAGTEELIDIEIDLKRVELNESLKIKYSGDVYGEGYTLYISEKDIKKIESETGNSNYYKPYKDITKSYIVGNSGDYIRLREEWNFNS